MHGLGVEVLTRHRPVRRERDGENEYLVIEHAGDLRAEFIFSLHRGLDSHEILSTIHTYPTLAEANKYAAGAPTLRHDSWTGWDGSTPGAETELQSWLRLSTVLALISGLIGIAPADEPSDHAAWDRLLRAHVVTLPGGHATRLDYAAVSRERAALSTYLADLATITQERFERWSDADQLACLINAYNAWTVELVLSRYPELASIKDLGGFLRSPWKKAFIPLLGALRSLDDIEHGLIRGSDRYRDPRIHFALNCASIGCPALRAEAYRGSVLESQLEDQTSRFLADRARNRLERNTLAVSSIFKWYREDFEQDWRGLPNLPAFLAHYALALGLSSDEASALRNGRLELEFLDYDWRLNDVNDLTEGR